MRRFGLVFALAVLTPAALQAQRKPSNSMHTRSAEVYITNARATSVAADRQEQLGKALEALLQGTKSDADNPKVWFLLGQTHALMGNAAAADSAFDKAESMYADYASETEPFRLDLWIRSYNEGVAALNAGDAAGAIAKFEAADAIYRGRPEALLSMGELQARAGDLAAAEQSYRSALEILRGPSGADLEGEKAAAWKENELQVTTELAALLADTGKPEEAAALYRELLERQPDNVQAKTNLAVTLSRAGKEAEAAKLYAELLAQPELSDVALFNIGVGLYRAQQFDQSVEAFSRAMERNAHSAETLYNLGQALVAAAAEADAARKAELNQHLLETAQRLHELDPNNRNVLMMIAQARQTLAEAESDAAKAEQLKRELVETLELAEAMPFDVEDVRLQHVEGGVTVEGTVANKKVAAGQPIALSFTFVGTDGQALGTEEVSITAPAIGASAPFSLEFATDAAVAGWRYTVAR